MTMAAGTPDNTRLNPTAISALALALSACGTSRYTHQDTIANDANQVVIKGYSRSFLFAADELAFDLSSPDNHTLIPYLTKATVEAGGATACASGAGRCCSGAAG